MKRTINGLQPERTKFGRFMYDLLMNWGIFVSKHMWVWWILSYTWALPMTLVGWIAYLIMLPFSKRRGHFGPCLYLIFGNNWGGLEMGTNFFVADNMGDWEEHTKKHECGHTFQICLLSIFYLFLIGIPSVCRYWYQRIAQKHGKHVKEYDIAYFEGAATDVGTYYYEHNLFDKKK